MATNDGPGQFAVLLQHYRAEAGLSQEELAEQSGLSRRGISDLERGQRRVPHPATVRRLAQALNLADGERAALLASARAHLMPSVSLGTHPVDTLPVQLTSFIGRQRELEELPRLLTTTRLLTVTGAGGIGKTRLALEVGRAVMHRYRDGVWLVELASLAEAALVPHAVAASLCVRAEAQAPLEQTLANFLQRRQVLLVLDNCEHLIGACAALTDALLRACPDLRALATSREPLGLAGETTWRLPSLSVPAFRPSAAVESAGEAEAVRLFVDRARAALPSFAPSNATVSAVARICQRLEGIPLAIELAAPQVRVISVQQIAVQLADTLRPLTSANRLAPPRHQTMRAALDWSYGLLSETEQRFFAHVAVFVGGWTLEAATEVAIHDDIQRGDALHLLGSLVDKSLVAADPHRDGTMRYRLLEPLRQYAREHLEASGEAERVQSRYVDYCIELGEQAEPHLRGGSQFASWLDRLQPEQDNLRAALRWCIDRGDVDRGLRLGGAVWRWWYEQGTPQEGREWLELLLRIAGGSRRDAYHARALNGAGVLACRQDDFNTAQAMLEESCSIWIALGEFGRTGDCLHDLAFVAEHRGDYETARRLYERALAVHQEHGDKIGEALTLNNFAWSLMEEGNYTRARELSAASISLYRQLDDDLNAVWPTMAMAWTLLNVGDAVAGRAAFSETLVFLKDRARGLRIEVILPCLEGLAAAAASLGESGRAVRLAAAVAHLREVFGRTLIESERGLLDPFLEPLYESVGAETLAEWSSEGQAFGLESAIAYALAAPERDRTSPVEFRRSSIRRSRASG